MAHIKKLPAIVRGKGPPKIKLVTSTKKYGE